MATASNKFSADTSADYFDAERKRFSQAISSGDQESAEQVTSEFLAAQQTLGDIYLKVIGPALQDIGDLWCRKEIGVGEEHLATQIVISQMDRLRTVYAQRNSRSAYRVMVACVEGEMHFIGARMVADLCLARGWNVDFLGPNVPNDAVIEMIKARHPQVLALSVTMGDGLAKARALIEAIERLTPTLGVVTGGQGAANRDDGRALGRHGEIALDAFGGMAAIGKLLRADRPGAALKEYQLVLARRVRNLRTQKGWTQEHLAEVTRVTRVCIVAVEGGKQNVSMDILVRLSNALGVAPETLLSVEE